MTSVETRDLLEKVARFRVNSNTKRVGKSRHVDGKLVVVGGERNPASLSTVLPGAGQGVGREPRVSSTVLPGAGQGAGREEMSHSCAG